MKAEVSRNTANLEVREGERDAGKCSSLVDMIPGTCIGQSVQRSRCPVSRDVDATLSPKRVIKG